MNALCWGMFALLAIACSKPDIPDRETDDSTSPADSIGEDSGQTDSGEVDTGPWDRDEDSYTSEVDCDDRDPDVNPGADEVFDGTDNDCDGVVDAQGSYSATIPISARGWFENTPYDFELQCPATMERALIDFELQVVCEIPADDTWGRKLLGATLTMTPDDPYLWELDAWSGTLIIESSEGWDTGAAATLQWTDMEQAALSISLDTAWLDATGKGTLKR